MVEVDVDFIFIWRFLVIDYFLVCRLNFFIFVMVGVCLFFLFRIKMECVMEIMIWLYFLFVMVL